MLTSKESLSLITFCLLLSGCDDGDNSNRNTPKLETTEIVELANGLEDSSTYTLDGYNSGKSISVIRNQSIFEEHWDELSDVLLPEVDFSREVVVILRHGETNTSGCQTHMVYSGVNAQYDPSGVHKLEIRYRQYCQNTAEACPGVYQFEFPYHVYKITASEQESVLISESYSSVNCK